jgi:hypothetical protein
MHMRSESGLTDGNLRVFQVISYTLVFLMMACIVMTVLSLIQSAFASWASEAMAAIALLVLVDRLLMHPRLKALTPYTLDWALMLTAQGVVILFVSRLLLSQAHGPESFASDLVLLRNMPADLLTMEYLVTIVLAVMVWDWAGQFLNLLDLIGLDRVQALAIREDPLSKEREQVPVHQRLVNLTFSLGILVVILTALGRLDLRAIFASVSGSANDELTRFSSAEAGALMYFLFGLGLISLSRLLALQTHWGQQRIPVQSRDLQRRWGLYAFYFIILLAVIVSLLPAGDSLGFFAVLRTLLAFLVGALFFVVQLLLLLFTLLINLPNLLLGRPLTFLNPFAAMQTQPPPPVAAGTPIPGSPILEFLRSVLLWGSLVVIVVYSIRQFIRSHEGIAAGLRRSRIAQLIMLAWAWLTGRVETFRGDLVRAVADGWSNLMARFERGEPAPRPGWLSLRSLDPRRQIAFFYLAMVRRAGEQGVDRKASQTPVEYAAALERALPAAQEEINSLTNGFMEARYSDHPLTSDDSKQVKSAWGRLRRALGLRRKRQK